MELTGWLLLVLVLALIAVIIIAVRNKTVDVDKTEQAVENAAHDAKVGAGALLDKAKQEYRNLTEKKP